ncbi:type I restriction enzyme subunit R domain-containing protein [Mycoplasmopsis edwardii]
MVLKDYNKYFKSDFSIEKGGFEDYYKDPSKQVKDKKIDLLTVVGMFFNWFWRSMTKHIICR